MLCVSIDVAMSKSMFLIMDENGEVFLEPTEYKHNLKDFNSLLKLINENKDKDVHIIMESTGIYHKPVERFFKENSDYEVIVINALISKINKTTLRKTKTDAIDCYNLADIFFSKRYNVQHNISDNQLELMFLSRRYSRANNLLIDKKTKLKELAYECFPEYKYFFKQSFYQYSSLEFMAKYPHPDYLRNKRIDTLAKLLNSSKCNNWASYYKHKIESFKDELINSYPSVNKDSFKVKEFKELALEIIDEGKRKDELEKKLISEAKRDRQFKIFNSIKGIGELTAALLVAELQDLTRFDNIKQATAYCGLDPGIRESGISINTRLGISKRGNKYARSILFNAIIVMIKTNYPGRNNNDYTFIDYYNKKRSEGKHHNTAVIACATKLLNILFTLSKKNKLYKLNYKQS